METPDRPRHRHRAKADGRLQFGSPARTELQSASALEESRTAGVLAARRAEELLPRTAGAELTDIDIDWEWDGNSTLRISAYIEGISRDDLGARALLAVNVCAANLADLAACSVDLERAEVTMERGGPQGFDYDFDPPVRAAVLSVSDAVASGDKDDRAGRAVREAVESMEVHDVRLTDDAIVEDDRDAIAETVRKWQNGGVDLVLTVGGTGLTHTDTTVEALEPLLDRRIPGIMEAVRDYGQEQTPVAFMSRGVAGLAGETLVVTLPGSTAGAEEASEVLFPAVLHVFRTLRKSAEHLQ